MPSRIGSRFVCVCVCVKKVVANQPEKVTVNREKRRGKGKIEKK